MSQIPITKQYSPAPQQSTNTKPKVNFGAASYSSNTIPPKTTFAQPTVPTAPKTNEPTIGSVINPPAPKITLDTTAPDDPYASVGKYFEDQFNDPVDENEIKSRTLRDFQTEIDATRGIYTQKLNDAKVAGEGRLGSTRASEARSGLLGSDFGNAQTDKTVANNTDINNSILEEQRNAIAEIMGKAREGANTEIAARRAAKEAGASAYLTYLGGRADRKKESLSNLGKLLLSKGIDDVSKVDDKSLAEIAKNYGTSVDEIRSSLEDAKTTKAKDDAALEKDRYQTLGDGTYLYDTKTHTIVSQNEKDSSGDDGFTLGKDQTRFDADGNPIASGYGAATAGTKSDTSQSVVGLIGELLDNPSLSKISGPFDQLLGGVSGKAALAKNKFNQLQGILKLDNRQQLKGSGAISDFEFKVLGEAASALGRNLSDKDFKDELIKLRDKLTAGDTSETGEASLTDTEKNTVQQMRADKIPDSVIEQVLGKKLSFNNVGNTKVSIPQSSRLSYANNNPANLRFAGQEGAVEGQGGFAKFSSPQAGVAALNNQIALDSSRGHSLASFIKKYAPPTENNTNQYLAQVVAYLGVSPTTPLAKIDKNALAQAILLKESGTRIG